MHVSRAMETRRPVKSARCSLVLLLTLGLSSGLGCKKKDEHKQSDDEPAPKREYVPPAPSTLEGYASVCSGSKVGAKPYEKHNDTKLPSKVVVFQKYLDEAKPQYGYARLDGLMGFQVKDNSEIADVELVACVDLKKKTKTKSQCNYYGGTIERWVMTYTLRIVDPIKGTELSKEEFELDPRSTGCKDTASFRQGNSSVYEGAEYGGRLLYSLLPLQAEGVQLPELKAYDLDDVCTGTPRPQAAAATAPSTVHVAYRPRDDYAWGLEARPKGVPKNEGSKQAPTSAKYVACITGKPETKKQSCNFMMGSVLEIYDGTVDVEVRETATGKVVGQQSFKANSRSCPDSHTFWSRPDVYFESVEPTLYDFVAGFVGGSLPGSEKPKPAAASGGGGRGRGFGGGVMP